MTLELGFRGYGEAEIAEAVDCLESGNVTMGAKTRRFEEMFAEYCGRKHAVMVNSGSSANLLAFAAAREAGLVKPGDEVVMPALTWSTTLWPALQMGLTAKLVDCERYTLNAPFQHGTRVAAHILGNASTMGESALIEDCCEALGVNYAGRKVGTRSVFSTFSFYFSHHMTTIEGGMVTTDIKEFADLLRSIRSHGWTRGTGMEGKEIDGIDPRFCFVHPGYNFRPMEIQAAFGIHQLPKVDAWNQRRREVYAEMREALERFGLFEFIRETPGTIPAWFCFPVFVHGGKRKALAEHLETWGIQTRPIVAGNLARHPVFKNHPLVKHGPLPNADNAMDTGLYWGCHPGVTEAQIDELAEAVEQFVEKKEAA